MHYSILENIVCVAIGNSIRVCPANSVCREGPFESTCECNPGYVSSVSRGVLTCICKYSSMTDW